MANIYTTERHGWRKKYQYQLVQAITGKKRRNIRYAMKKLGLGSETEDFAEYLKLYFKNERYNK